MPFAIAVYTSDPNLLRCELARLRCDFDLDEFPPEPLGAGWFSDENILLQRYSAKVRPRTLDALGPVLESDSLLVHSGELPLGMSQEENTQPFRYRNWLFAHHGHIGGARFRREAQDLLPDFLSRAVQGSTQSELAFGLFLSKLHELGRTLDPRLEPTTAAKVLGETARTVARLSEAENDELDFFATNNHVLAAARLGPAPMHFRLLEGSPTCELCSLDGRADSQTSVRAHLRRKTVVIATGVRQTAGWIEVESGNAIGVSRNLHVESIPF